MENKILRFYKLTSCDGLITRIVTDSFEGDILLNDNIGNFISFQVELNTFCGYLELYQTDITPEDYVEITPLETCYCNNCYTLTNCSTGESFNTTQNLFPYFIQEKLVQFKDLKGCWEITINEDSEDCECANTLIVINTFEKDECLVCNPLTYYKLTSCESSGISKYTDQDLSDYLGKVVNLENCEGCWIVESTLSIPNNLTTVNILNSFDNCAICNSTFYKLTNCEDLQDVIFTYSNLSSYVGKTVKIKYCTSCFTVESANSNIDIISSYQTVDVTQSFLTCDLCTTPIIIPEEPSIKLQYVQPNLITYSCSLKEYTNRSCDFATYYYQEVISSKLGVKFCCTKDKLDSTIKYELLLLDMITDPNYTCTTTCSCECNN